MLDHTLKSDVTARRLEVITDVRPFSGDRQNLLGDAEGGGIGGGDVMEEGSDRGKPGLARCDGVVPLLIEKGENKVPIEILKGERIITCGNCHRILIHPEMVSSAGSS